jgi:hypothetical protein
MGFKGLAQYGAEGWNNAHLRGLQLAALKTVLPASNPQSHRRKAPRPEVIPQTNSQAGTSTGSKVGRCY